MTTRAERSEPKTKSASFRPSDAGTWDGQRKSLTVAIRISPGRRRNPPYMGDSFRRARRKAEVARLRSQQVPLIPHCG